MTDDAYKNLVPITLGGCVRIKFTIHIIEAAKKTPNTVFYSTDQYLKLIDFVYRDYKNHFHAFQATIGKTHKATPKYIKELQKKVGGGKNLSLYYLVPAETFHGFVTHPVNPGIKDEGITCDIYHVKVPKPNDESTVTAKEEQEI
jgi:hypothetical protein